MGTGGCVSGGRLCVNIVMWQKPEKGSILSGQLTLYPGAIMLVATIQAHAH
jgi:hypothetical protein